MVEIEDSEIGFTAIGARVIPQLLADERDTRSLLRVRAFSDHCNVMLPIPAVVLARRRAIALSADFLPSVRARGLPIERGQRLDRPARAAALLRFIPVRMTTAHPACRPPSSLADRHDIPTQRHTRRFGGSNGVGPVGIEPTTRGLTCHFGFRRRRLRRSWSGLSLHRGSRRRCHPSSLYTFRTAGPAWLGIANWLPRKGSPTLSGVIPGVSSEALLFC